MCVSCLAKHAFGDHELRYFMQMLLGNPHHHSFVWSVPAHPISDFPNTVHFETCIYTLNGILCPGIELSCESINEYLNVYWCSSFFFHSRHWMDCAYGYSNMKCLCFVVGGWPSGFSNWARHSQVMALGEWTDAVCGEQNKMSLGITFFCSRSMDRSEEVWVSSPLDSGIYSNSS